MINKVKINNLDVCVFESQQHAVESFIKDGKIASGMAIAVNPEKIVSAYYNNDVREILASANYLYSDGIGVVKLLHKRGALKAARVPGCELWEDLQKAAAKCQLKVFLIGSKPETLRQTKDLLKSKYDANVIGAIDGYFDDESAVIAEVKEKQPDFVSVAMGSPKQEKLIAKLMNVHPDCFYMGVGGTYDVFTGNVKRAPKFYCDYGLEWFYRLASQPTRIGRQINLLKFIWLALRKKI